MISINTNWPPFADVVEKRYFVRGVVELRVEECSRGLVELIRYAGAFLSKYVRFFARRLRGLKHVGHCHAVFDPCSGYS